MTKYERYQMTQESKELHGYFHEDYERLRAFSIWSNGIAYGALLSLGLALMAYNAGWRPRGDVPVTLLLGGAIFVYLQGKFTRKWMDGLIFRVLRIVYYGKDDEKQL